MHHHTASAKYPPRNNVPTPFDKIRKTLREEGVLVASPADIPKRATVGPNATVRHAEPMLELDADAIEEVATPVVEPSELGPVVRIDGVHKDVETVILELMEKVERLEDQLRRVTRRLIDHSHGDARRAKDDINERILELLRQVAPVKLTTNAIADNLELESTQVGNRLRNMVGKNGVKSAKRAGTNTGISWWVDKGDA